MQADNPANTGMLSDHDDPVASSYRQQQQQQQQNRYAHLVTTASTIAPNSNKIQTVVASRASSNGGVGGEGRHYQAATATTSSTKAPCLKIAASGNPQQQQRNGVDAPYNKNAEGPAHANASRQSGGGGGGGGGGGNNKNNYYQSFSGLDWREQWIMLKEKTLEKVEEPTCQRKLIMLIVCTALLLDNMLYMVIVPIIPDYLRSIGAWSTYTENAKWVMRNSSRGRAQWEQVGGQTIYEGEDSAVGLLFASKAIVQLIANPFSGAIADRIGYEIPMMFGLIVMFLSTMVFACGQTYSVLFLARSLQGVGSAFADTPGIAMLADRFTEETERRRAQGIAIAFISFGCLVAPPFGSVLYQGAGKEVPFILLSLVCLIDGSLLLLVAPPGTFSVLWPSNFYKNQQAAATAAAAAARRGPARPAMELASKQQVPGAFEQADEGGTGSYSQTADAQTSGSSQAADKKRALMRQKSISRRHSMTMSAGEAPKGTPIEVLLRDPCIACCAGALVVANVSLAFLEPTISIWVKNTMPDTEEWQEGLIWLPAFFPHVLGVFATLHFAEKYPAATWKIATSGLLIEGFGCLLVPFCTSFWSLIMPISIICFGVALIDTAILPTLGYLVDTRFTSVYGNVYAIADISYSVSYAIGPIIAGGIVEAIGFTALNVLIAIVTFGYTPILAMLRTIREYQPFEADQTGRLAERDKPFGKFGRAPVADDEQDPESGGNRFETYDERSGGPAAPLASQSSLRQKSTTASGDSSSLATGGHRAQKSVKIVESHEQQQQQEEEEADDYMETQQYAGGSDQYRGGAQDARYAQDTNPFR